MELGVSTIELLLLVGALLAAGLLTGFMSGLLGIGGGGILVPLLYEVFGFLNVDPAIRMHLTLGTSLAVIIPTSLRSFATHRSKGGVDNDFLWRIGPYMVLGVIAGSVAAGIVTSNELKWVWVIFGGLLALKLALGRDDWRLGEQFPKPPWVEVYGVVTGLASVLMSIAGGSFVVAFMTLYNKPLIQAVATSAGLGPFVAIPGAVGFVIAGWGNSLTPDYSLGFVNVVAAAMIVPASLVAAPIGVRLAHGLPKRKLELAFAAFMAIAATRFALSLLGVV
ncbi:MAG: sulfite exporter TauE/SafE family protein [Filomicrobium sp.]